MGIDFDHAALEPLEVIDSRGIVRTFDVESFLAPTGHLLTARERVVSAHEGWQFKVLGDAEADVLQLVARLYARVRSALNDPCLDERLSPKAPRLWGRITCDLDGDGAPLVVIDGRPFTWDEFGALFAAHEGSEFELRFEDGIAVVGVPARRR